MYLSLDHLGKALLSSEALSHLRHLSEWEHAGSMDGL